MAFKATITDDYRIIEVQYSGMVSTFEVFDALATRASLADQHDIKDHLIDCSRVEKLPNVTDLYLIASRIREILDTPIHKAAMVIPESIPLATMLLYFIIRAALHGVHIELFNDRQAAIGWLAGSEHQLNTGIV
jgi:hypothetical protein